MIIIQANPLMKLSVKDALDRSHCWKKTLHFYCAAVDVIENQLETVMYKREELDAYDIRLWPVLEEMHSRHVSHKMGVNSDLMRLTLEYWQGNAKLVTCEKGHTHFARQCDAFVYYPEQSLARLTLENYIVLRTQDEIDYVMDTQWSRVYVTEAWLDDNYPGWKQRWEVSQALSFESNLAATDYILSGLTVQPAIALGDIDFT